MVFNPDFYIQPNDPSKCEGKIKTYSDMQDSKTEHLMKEEAMTSKNRGSSKGNGKRRSLGQGGGVKGWGKGETAGSGGMWGWAAQPEEWDRTWGR